MGEAVKSSYEWYTPEKYINAAREVLGGFDLDPASCTLANSTIKAETYYTKEENGLLLPWYGRVWLNPPYSETGKWTKRLVAEYRQGHIKEAIVTVNVSSDTYWFQELLEYIHCLVHGRIDFDNPLRPSKRPRYASAFFYLGMNEQHFTKVFSQFGTIEKKVCLYG